MKEIILPVMLITSLLILSCGSAKHTTTGSTTAIENTANGSTSLRKNTTAISDSTQKKYPAANTTIEKNEVRYDK